MDILLHISRQILFFYFVTNGRASCRKKILGPVPNISAKEVDSKEIIKVSLRERWEALDREPQEFHALADDGILVEGQPMKSGDAKRCRNCQR